MPPWAACTLKQNLIGSMGDVAPAYSVPVRQLRVFTPPPGFYPTPAFTHPRYVSVTFFVFDLLMWIPDFLIGI